MKGFNQNNLVLLGMGLQFISILGMANPAHAVVSLPTATSVPTPSPSPSPTPVSTLRPHAMVKKAVVRLGVRNQLRSGGFATYFGSSTNIALGGPMIPGDVQSSQILRFLSAAPTRIRTLLANGPLDYLIGQMEIDFTLADLQYLGLVPSGVTLASVSLGASTNGNGAICSDKQVYDFNNALYIDVKRCLIRLHNNQGGGVLPFNHFELTGSSIYLDQIYNLNDPVVPRSLSAIGLPRSAGPNAVRIQNGLNYVVLYYFIE